MAGKDDINFSSVKHYTQLPKDGPEIELLNEIKKFANMMINLRFRIKLWTFFK